MLKIHYLPHNKFLTPWSLNETCCLHINLWFPNSWVLTETTGLFHSPQQLIQSPNSLLSLQHLSHLFSDIFASCHTEKVEAFKNDTQHSFSHLYTPCSLPFPWSEDIRCLSFLVKVIHSYLPRLYSTYFNLSPIFSSSLTSLLLLVQKHK